MCRSQNDGKPVPLLRNVWPLVGNRAAQNVLSVRLDVCDLVLLCLSKRTFTSFRLDKVGSYLQGFPFSPFVFSPLSHHVSPPPFSLPPPPTAPSSSPMFPGNSEPYRSFDTLSRTPGDQGTSHDHSCYFCRGSFPRCRSILSAFRGVLRKLALVHILGF